MKKSECIEKYGVIEWERRKAHNRAYYADHREELLIKKKEYGLENKEILSDRHKKYRDTKNGRAKIIVRDSKRFDKKYNRGETTITPEWIIDNIFTSSCYYCGDNDWTHLGVDRIDNTKPHTPDNCICACGKCNVKRKDRYSVKEFKKMMSEQKFKK